MLFIYIEDIMLDTYGDLGVVSILDIIGEFVYVRGWEIDWNV